MYKKDLHDIIRFPIVTEKATSLSDQGIYVIKVLSSASKPVIAKAIEYVFKTKVKNVKILNQQGKIKYFKGRKGKQNSFKKAFVRLQEGCTIDLLGISK